MTDKAYTESPTSFAASILARREAKPRAADKVVSLPPRSADGSPPADSVSTPANPADFSSAIDLIHEASEAIRISEERADELQAQLDQFAEQASGELRRLSAELTACEKRLALSEERLRTAEARANEAESWLARLHEAVFSAFSPIHQRRSAIGPNPGRPYEAPRD